MNEELQKAIAELLIDCVGIDVLRDVRDGLVELAQGGDELSGVWEKAIGILDGEEDTPTPTTRHLTPK